MENMKPVYIIDVIEYKKEQQERKVLEMLVDALKSFVPKECEYCINYRENMVDGFCENSCKPYDMRHYKLDRGYILTLGGKNE